jgi:ATP-dependent RNA helicase DeaD
VQPTAHGAPNVKLRDEIFDEATDFASLGLRNSVIKGLTAAGFQKPTGVQAKLIPMALTGRDILGQAKTGTGKTAAFGLPLLNMCDRDKPFQALVLAPTRELAIQITAEIDKLGKFTPIRSTTVYGGQAIRSQADKLAKGAQIIVGTPGRVMDMVQRGLLHFNNLRFAVLDEVDRMLDIGFREDIRRILDMCPPPRESLEPGAPGRQTIMVSATLSPEIERLARRYMSNPEKLIITSGSLTVSLVEQYYLPVQPWDKKRLLVHLLQHEEPALTVVFCRLKRTVDELARHLAEKGIDAIALHGDMPQGKRNQTMQRLRSGSLEVLISSDLTSRGIDVEGISHVINYDLPDDVELYVHRIGRTARAGRGGTAWAFVTPAQGELLTQIELLINAEIPKLEYPGFVPGPKPSHWRDEAPGGRREGGLTLASPPGGGPGEGAPPPQKVNRIAATVNPELPSAQAADPTKFPGGVVPAKLPPKMMHGRIRGGRR